MKIPNVLGQCTASKYLSLKFDTLKHHLGYQIIEMYIGYKEDIFFHILALVGLNSSLDFVCLA